MKCTCTRISIMKERLSHLFIIICCCVQVEFVSSHNCKVCLSRPQTHLRKHQYRSIVNYNAYVNETGNETNIKVSEWE